MTFLRWAAVLLALAAPAGCGPRGHLSLDPSAAAFGDVETLFVATSRRARPGYEIFGRERSEKLAYGRFAVSVPPDRKPGTVTFPSALPGNPRTDFLTVAAARINGSDGFPGGGRTRRC